MPCAVQQLERGSCLLALSIALQRLTPPPHPSVPPGCTGIGATSTFHRTYNLGQVYFTFLPPAFQFGPRKKQADAGVRPKSVFPNMVLGFRKFHLARNRCKLWNEHMSEFSQFPPLSSFNYRNFFSHPSFDRPHLMSIVYSNLPRIAMQLWRSFPLLDLQHSRK